MIESKYKWNLEDIYLTNDEFGKDINQIYELLNTIQSYKGKLPESSQNIYDCYRNYEELVEIFDRVYAYGMLKYHQNMSDNSNIEVYKRVEDISTDISMQTSYIVPEITNLEEATIKRFIDENNDLKRYERILNEILEDKKHILSNEEESLLASLSDVFSAPENTFDIFTNTEFKYPNITDENGNEVELTDGTYSKYIASNDRKVRIEAFNSMYSLYKKHINTITELYLTRVKSNTVMSRIRKYNSSLEKAVKNDDATIKVYESLIDVVNENLDVNHRYIELKKKMLNLDELHIYDMYVNKFKDNNEEITYEEAKDTVLKGLEVLGEKYVNVLKEAFENRWIDVYEEANKMSGAYSLGLYGIHPFVLTNFTGTTRDVSTIAHELGHSMHSYYSNNEQNVLDANYTIMVAEVASTVNEILLSQYLIDNEKDLNKKAALINERIDDLRATLIRQSMFAEFEKIVHEKVEAKQILTSDSLCEIYYELNKKYFGEKAIIDENIKYEWARIPHFYRCFYVYKYATGISAAIAIAKKILENKNGILDKYIEMLKQGQTKKSVDLLKMVEVDLESKEPYQKAFEYYKENIDELEKIINTINSIDKL